MQSDLIYSLSLLYISNFILQILQPCIMLTKYLNNKVVLKETLTKLKHTKLLGVMSHLDFKRLTCTLHTRI